MGKFARLQNIEFVIFMYKYFRIPANLPEIERTENLPVLIFVLMRGITVRPLRLNLLQRGYESHCAFVVAIECGIHLLEREPCNAADQINIVLIDIM